MYQASLCESTQLFVQKIFICSTHSSELGLQGSNGYNYKMKDAFSSAFWFAEGRRLGKDGSLSAWCSRHWPVLVRTNPEINQPTLRGQIILAYRFMQETEAGRVEMNLSKVTQLALFIYSLTCSKKDFRPLSHIVRKFLVVFVVSQEKQDHIYIFLKLK